MYLVLFSMYFDFFSDSQNLSVKSGFLQVHLREYLDDIKDYRLHCIECPTCRRKRPRPCALLKDNL